MAFFRTAGPFSARLLAAALWSLVLAGAARPAASAPQATPSGAVEAAVRAGPGENVLQGLLDTGSARWAERRNAARRGDRTGADRAIGELLDTLHEHGVSRTVPLAHAAILEGRRELEEGNTSAALASFRLARTLDPRQPAAYWGEARAEYAAGHGLLAVAGSAGQAVVARWGSFWPAYGDALEFGTILLLALLATGAAVVVTLLVVHGPSVVHEIEERLPATWHQAWRRAVGWTLVLSPAAVQWLGVFALLPWVVLLAAFAGASERRLMYAWLLVIACAVPAFGVASALFGVWVSPNAGVALDSADRALCRDLLPRLAALADAHPDDGTWRVLTARLVAQSDPEQAIHMLRQAADIDPRDAAARIALGNILFRSGKYEPAAVLYREALQLDPTSALAAFNLSRARSAVLDMSGAEDALAGARQVSLGEVRQLQAATPGDGVADPEYDVSALGRRLVRVEAGPQVRRALSIDNPVSLAALATLVAAFVARLRWGGNSSRRCERCGSAFCGRCGGDESVETCVACGHLFSRREGLAPGARHAQARRVDRRLKRLARGRLAAQALWPGLALVHEGRTLAGAGQAFLWAALVLGAVMADRIVPSPALMPPWVPGVPFAVAAALFWAVAQLPRFRPGLAAYDRAR